MKTTGANQSRHHAEGTDRQASPSGAAGEPLPGLLADAVDSLAVRDEAAPWSASLTAEDRARLTAALGGRAGQVSLDAALAADLVEAVLPQTLAALVEGKDARRRLVVRIAGTLLDDPVSTARLQTLVTALGNDAAGAGPVSAGGSPP